MRDTVLAGWYGNGNVGDEAILLGILRAVRATEPRYPMTVFSASPKQTASTFAVDATRRSLPVRGSQLLVELATMIRHDLYVLGGGGLIKDVGSRPGNVHRWLRPVRAAQVLGKRTMLYAVGVESVCRQSRRIIRRTLDRCELVTVRDPDSRRRLVDIGVRARIVVTSDPAILLEPPCPAENVVASSRPIVAVSLRGWLTSGYRVDAPELIESIDREIAAALDELIERHGVHVRFVPFRQRVGDDDRLAFEAVASRMRHRGQASVLPLPTPDAAVAMFSECELVIGMRLHSAILAAAAGTPFVAIAYAPKLAAFSEHIGVPGAVVQPSGGSDCGKIAAQIIDGFQNRQARRARLALTVPMHRQLARLGGRMLVALAADDEVEVERCIDESILINHRLSALTGTSNGG